MGASFKAKQGQWCCSTCILKLTSDLLLGLVCVSADQHDWKYPVTLENPNASFREYSHTLSHFQLTRERSVFRSSAHLI
jgi:hypothetical protein